MKSTLLIFLLLGILQRVHAQENMDIFLMMGQSNMAGRGDLEGQILSLDSIYMLDKDNRWIPASEPIHFDKPVAGAGLGASFAIAARKPGREIGLVPCAVGGTSISVWKPGALDSVTRCTPYNDAISRTISALKSGSLKGILWHQGESDSNLEKYKTYEENFENLLSNLAHDLSLDIDTIPVITGELGYFFITKPPLADNEGMYINSVLHRLAQKKTNRYCVSAAGLNHKGDSTHFDTPSLRELGLRYGEAYKIVESRLSRSSSR